MDIYDLPSSDDDEPMLKDEISETASEQQNEDEKLNDDDPILKHEADTASRQEDESDDQEPLDNLKAEPEENPRDREERDERASAHRIPEPKARRPYNDDDDDSIGSHYSPPSSDDEEGSEDDTAHRPRGANPNSSSNSNHDGSLGHEQSQVPAPVTLQQKPYQPGPRSPLKRERQDSLAGGIAHNHNSNTTSNGRQVKRIKGSFNQHYLDLLNQEIQDAGFLHSRSQLESSAESRPSSCSSSSSSSSLEFQTGLPTWTNPEKEALFKAVSRTGGAPHNTAAIASRIKTKTQFEVAQYLHLLESSLKERKLLKRNDSENITISMAEIPAAMEISQPCCHALEKAADNLARKEEIDEEKGERERWGDTWLISEFTLGEVEKPSGTTKPGLLNALELFRMRNWLELSERVFMNTSFPVEDNWVSITSIAGEAEGSVEEGTKRPEGPSIRATALEEFYSIVVSLTRRIVATTLYMSDARINAQRESRYREVKEEVVWEEDVEAAVLSLGLPGRTWGNGSQGHGWEEFWAGAARRLRLEIYEGDLPPFTAGKSDGPMHTPMSYHEVERKLSGRGKWEDIPIKQEEDAEAGHGYRRDDDGYRYRHSEGTQSEGGGGQNVPSSPARSSEISETRSEEEAQNQHEREQVENEVDEFIEAARPFVIPGNIKKLMRRRVRAARAQEDYADQMDMKASREEERRLWALLGGQEELATDDGDDGDGDGEIIKAEEDGDEEENSRYTLPGSGKGTVEELYEYFCGDEVGFEGGLRGEEHGDSTGWRFIGVGMEDVELEEDEEEARGNSKHGKLNLGRISAWEVAWMDEKRRRERERERGRYMRDEM